MGAFTHLQRLAGNRAMAGLVLQRQETSFPEDAESQLQAGPEAAGDQEQETAQTFVQRRSVADVDRRSPRIQRSSSTASSDRVVQRAGGATVGMLSIRSNVISAGLTAGHAWLSYTPTGGAEETWGTWGNLSPKGLYRNREVGFGYAASRSTAVDAADRAAVDAFAASNNAWSLTNNCASFAARGWAAVIGESLAHTSAFIPNPSALGAGIQAANGGAPIGTRAAPAAAPAPAGGGGP